MVSPDGRTRPSLGRAVMVAVGVCYLGLVVHQAVTLPDRVPGHVGATGEVTWWGDRTGHVMTTSVLGAVVFLLFWLAPWMVRRLPADLVNLPHKDYWLAPRNRDRAAAMVRDDMGWIGAATLGLVGFAMWRIGAIARGGEGLGVAFWVLLAAYLVVVIGWSVRMPRSPRWQPPASGAETGT